MEFITKVNMTSTERPFGGDSYSSLLQQSATTLGFSGFVATLVAFSAYLSYTPPIDKKAPAFTSDKSLFVGSLGFFRRRWSFWTGSVERSKTGQFSFWLGKHHIIGLTGEGPRKLFLDNRWVDRISAAKLHGVGPENTPPIHPIFQRPEKGHNYFQRRVLDLVKTKYLEGRLPLVIRDARIAFEEMAKDPSGVTNLTEARYRLVLAQSARVVGADEISNTPELLDSYLYYTKLFAHCARGDTTARPWLRSWSRIKRAWGRSAYNSIVTPSVEKRMGNGAPRGKDALQVLIDNGDSADYIITFFISILFISVANAGKLAGLQLNMVAHRIYWQEKMYSEIKAAAAAHSTNKKASLVEQLDSLPLEAWETSFPSIDICLREAIRLHVHFPMTRKNLSRNALPIPGTGEVIPPGSYVAYFTSDAHLNEEMYPKAQDYDPERYLESRPEVERQAYGFLGWGNGTHRCVGQRWAKLQHNIIMAYALAMFEWRFCDANRKLIPAYDRKMDLDNHGNALPQGIYCKRTPRKTV